MNSKKIIQCATLVCATAVFLSCNKQEEINFQNSPQTESLQISEGSDLLTFSAIKDVQKTVSFMKEHSSPINLKELYNKGFIPLKVSDNVDEYTFSKIQSIKTELTKFQHINLMTRNSSETSALDEDELIISNDEFASILNYKGEIQIADTIYRYTNMGLFFTHKDNLQQLNNYLENLTQDNIPNHTGKLLISSNIFHYVPQRDSFNQYAVVMPGDLIDDHDYGGGNAGGGGNTPNIDIPSNTDNYNVCVNEKASWIDNIFGKSYACDYKFNSDRKLRTTFAVEDYYIFFDVYAKAKFKKKTLLGWYSCRETNRVYLKINQVGIEFADRKFSIKINASSDDLSAAYNKMESIFSNSTNKKAAFLSNVYSRSGNNIIVNEYQPTFSELSNYANGSHDYLYTPTEVINRHDINFDYSEYFGNRVSNVFVITLLGKTYEVSKTDILNLLKSNLKRFIPNNDPAGVLVVSPSLDGKKSEILSYIITDELHDVRNMASVSRTFDVPKGFKIKSLNLSTKKVANDDPTFRIDIEFAWKTVKSYDVNIETGAYFNGKWGGSKFIVEKN